MMLLRPSGQDDFLVICMQPGFNATVYLRLTGFKLTKKSDFKRMEDFGKNLKNLPGSYLGHLKRQY